MNGRITQGALEQGDGLGVVPTREESLGCAAPHLVPVMCSARSRFEVLGVSHGALDVGKLEPQGEAGPTRCFERRRSCDGLIEKFATLANVLALIGRSQQGKGGEGPVEFALRRLPERQDRRL